MEEEAVFDVELDREEIDDVHRRIDLGSCSVTSVEASRKR
jgi:hypothetical protein